MRENACEGMRPGLSLTLPVASVASVHLTTRENPQDTTPNQPHAPHMDLVKKILVLAAAVVVGNYIFAKIAPSLP